MKWKSENFNLFFFYFFNFPSLCNKFILVYFKIRKKIFCSNAKYRIVAWITKYNIPEFSILSVLHDLLLPRSLILWRVCESKQLHSCEQVGDQPYTKQKRHWGIIIENAVNVDLDSSFIIRGVSRPCKHLNVRWPVDNCCYMFNRTLGTDYSLSCD